MLKRKYKRFWFQQDNARPHFSKTAMSFFSANGVQLLDWPLYSSNLSPIENIWSILTKNVYNGQPFSTKKEFLEKNWRGCRKFARSIPKASRVLVQKAIWKHVWHSIQSWYRCKIVKFFVSINLYFSQKNKYNIMCKNFSSIVILHFRNIKHIFLQWNLPIGNTILQQ